MQLRLLRTAIRFGPGTACRLHRWSADWAGHDPDEPHVHLGPGCVDERYRSEGIGSLLLLRHTAALDAVGAIGYLETDQARAVELYRRFGYAVVHRAQVLGVRCWFMRRPAV
jgi:GNAT superfamily N-acetyltransferase